MPIDMRLAERTGLITGAGGGIGRATAVALARRGCHLALADIDGGGLDATCDLVAAAAPKSPCVSRHLLDVTDRGAIAALPAAVRAAHGGLDILVNNAGVALGGMFEDVAEEDFDWLFAVNFFGVVRMTRAFLPMLRESDDARIVNISSVFGLIATPGQAAYTASKYAVRGFSESLRHELDGSPVGVTTIHPGGVATSIARSARVPRGVEAKEAERQKRAFEAFLNMAPEKAAEGIVRAIAQRRARVIIGRDAKIAAAIERVLPVRHWDLLKRFGPRPKRAGGRT
jgi:NAD(P)-dependent dehydrogenase (short-subunit alcohol dehydrogenase family)